MLTAQNSSAVEFQHESSATVIDAVYLGKEDGEPDDFMTRNYARHDILGNVEVCLASKRRLLGTFTLRKVGGRIVGTPKKSACQWASIESTFKHQFPNKQFNAYGYRVLNNQEIRLSASTGNYRQI